MHSYCFHVGCISAADYLPDAVYAFTFSHLLHASSSRHIFVSGQFGSMCLAPPPLPIHKGAPSSGKSPPDPSQFPDASSQPHSCHSRPLCGSTYAAQILPHLSFIGQQNANEMFSPMFENTLFLSYRIFF